MKRVDRGRQEVRRGLEVQSTLHRCWWVVVADGETEAGADCRGLEISVCVLRSLASRDLGLGFGAIGQSKMFFHFYIFLFFTFLKTGHGSGFQVLGVVTEPVPESSRALKVNARIRFFHTSGPGFTQTAYAGSLSGELFCHL